MLINLTYIFWKKVADLFAGLTIFLYLWGVTRNKLNILILRAMTKTIAQVMNDIKNDLKSYGLEGVEVTKRDAQFALDMYDNGEGVSYDDAIAMCVDDIRNIECCALFTLLITL